MIVNEIAQVLNVDYQDGYGIHKAVCSLIPHLSTPGTQAQYTYATLAVQNTTLLLVRSPKDLKLEKQVQKDYFFTEGQAIDLVCHLGIGLVPPKGDPRGRKMFFYTGKELDAYLERKVSSWGINIDKLAVSEVHHYYINKDQVGNSHKFFIPWVHIRVIGTVSNPLTLENAFVTGVGYKKGFGFGLLRLQN